MPFSADLRCGQFKLNMNISWVYQTLEDMDYDWEFVNDAKGDYQRKFEYYMEEQISKYILVKAFGETEGEENEKMNEYENISQFIMDTALEYKCPHFKLKNPDEVDSDSDMGAEEGTESQWHCDQHEDHPLLHDGFGGYNCPLCDEEDTDSDSEDEDGIKAFCDKHNANKEELKLLNERIERFTRSLAELEPIKDDEEAQKAQPRINLKGAYLNTKAILEESIRLRDNLIKEWGSG